MKEDTITIQSSLGHQHGSPGLGRTCNL